MIAFYFWRRGRDSNPRYACIRTQHFQCCALSQLDHLSVIKLYIISNALIKMVTRRGIEPLLLP